MDAWAQPGILAFAGFVVAILGALATVIMAPFGMIADAPFWMVPLGLFAIIVAKAWHDHDQKRRFLQLNGK